jgi:ABC-type branched-subunit amino acid transport system ATPase component
MIRIEDLWAGYGGRDIVRGIELRVGRGSVNCIVGPNGAGKSTVLKTISGLLKPRTGSIVVDGTELTHATPNAILREGIVQVPQRHGLFTRLTVRQNVLMGAYVIRRRRKEIDERYERLAETFPLLAARQNVSAASLSGGQRRMVEFAKAMMLEPKVVLLDEPTLGLDIRSLAIIRDSILSMNKSGTTVLMVEQNVRFGLSLADQATVMSAGSVVLTGPAKDVADHPDLMAMFFGAANSGGTTSEKPEIRKPIDPSPSGTESDSVPGLAR